MGFKIRFEIAPNGEEEIIICCKSINEELLRPERQKILCDLISASPEKALIELTE